MSRPERRYKVRYEYQVLEESRRKTVERKLNDLVRDGWELVEFGASGGTFGGFFYALLRRSVET